MNILNANPYVRCHQDIFIFPFLANHQNGSAWMYEEDIFRYKRMLYLAACGDAEKTFFWISNRGGTFCHSEKQVFTPNTNAYNDAQYEKPGFKETIYAYLIEVTGVVGQEVVGNIYEIDRKAYSDMVMSFGKASLQTHELITGHRDINYHIIPVAPETMATVLRIQRCYRESVAKAG